MAKELPRGTFWNDEHTTIFMVRCPKCNQENWAMVVAKGVCAWCGYDINADKEYTE